MLAELAAANAAFAIIKQAISNGSDLYKAGKAFGDLMGAKEDLNKRLAKERQSGGSENMLESFMALEKIREQEAHIREKLIWEGRSGLWADYQKFCEEAKQARRNAERRRHRRKQEILDAVVIGGIVLTLLGMVALMIWGSMYLRGDI